MSSSSAIPLDSLPSVRDKRASAIALEHRVARFVVFDCLWIRHCQCPIWVGSYLSSEEIRESLKVGD